MAWSAAVASTVLWATIRAGDDRSRDDRLRTHPLVDGALLVRPCAGAEASLGRALGSTSAAVRSFPIRVRFALASREDAALAEAARAADRLNAEGTDASVVVSGAIAPNRKADQLARTLANELDPPSIVIVADSDVDLSGVSLDALVRPLDDPRVAAAWAAPVEVAPTTIGDRASAAVLDASLHSFGLLAALDRNGMVGKLFAVRRDALEHVGGFGAMVEHLGEDMELARRLRAAGWRDSLAKTSAPRVVPRAARTDRSAPPRVALRCRVRRRARMGGLRVGPTRADRRGVYGALACGTSTPRFVAGSRRCALGRSLVARVRSRARITADRVARGRA
jgi:ceramide glucosyltransferase